VHALTEISLTPYRLNESRDANWFAQMKLNPVIDAFILRHDRLVFMLSDEKRLYLLFRLRFNRGEGLDFLNTLFRCRQFLCRRYWHLLQRRRNDRLDPRLFAKIGNFVRIRGGVGKHVRTAIQQYILLPGGKSLLGNAPILPFLETVKTIHTDNDQETDRQQTDLQFAHKISVILQKPFKPLCKL
jgi:hypothetical protein